MEISELRRMKLRQENISCDINNKNRSMMISESAREKLGYNFMSSQNREAEDIIRFEGALNNLNIKPFLPDDIKKYKDIKSGGKIGKLYKDCDFGDPILRLLLLIMFIVIPSMILIAIASVIFSKINDITYNSLYFGGIGLLYLTSFIFLTLTRPKYNKGWYCLKLEYYDAVIPEEVLLRATSIKDAFPEVNFLIEELLSDHNYASSKKEDKILVAVVEEKRYYIDIWE